MTVYNINLGIGWASSGVEYAQAYRAQAFRQAKVPAKFIFSDLILGNNIADLTENIGFDDRQIIWLYNFFTDIKIAPSTYPLSSFLEQEQLTQRNFKLQADSGTKEIRYQSDQEAVTIIPRYNDRDKQTIDQVSYVANNLLIKRDFYSYTKYATEYYGGDAQDNHVVFREFYNEDGSIAYTQHLDSNKQELFEFPQQYFYTKTDLYREMLRQLDFKADDTIILDRMDEDKQLINGPLIFAHHGQAKLFVAVHADHYDKHYTNDHQVLWNNFYEYQFTHYDDVDCFIVATNQQQQLLGKQLKHYYHAQPEITTIPVGSLDKLVKPTDQRKPHSLITASRLANEKHIDWLVSAVVAAQKVIPDVTLDIYGAGSQAGRLQELITKNHADDYIKLMGQHDLSQVYQRYETYIAGSTSEGFGLSLLEAVGSGLSMIGFDVPYGNQTFIDDQQNGYLLPYEEDWNNDKKEKILADAIIKTFSTADLTKFHEHSYALAEPYLTTNVAEQWRHLLKEETHA